ncbi:MAG: helix-turn-helix transcriptional regulator [Blastocatellia bacterium]|nr:helix-turn-helix transcriptional regulator [Blastocatellia bacterium]
MDDKDLYSGLIRLHVLHHACQEPIFGTGIIEELARHGYRLSPGTLYPLLHGLEKKGYLQSYEETERRQNRRVYRATDKGHKALAAAKVKVHELFSELLEDEPPKDLTSRKAAITPDPMHELAIQLKVTTLPSLRQGVSKVKDPKAQALLEASAAVVEGLIKAFDHYEKKRKG